MNDEPLLLLALRLATLSLVAVGGANSVLPDIHRFVVDVNGWMTDAEFAALFAIGQAAPGPNVMIVTLVGWHVAGLLGATVATIAMCGPSCLLTFVMARAWYRFNEKPWWPPVRAGLTSVTVGLVLATAYVLTDAADETLAAYLVTAVTALVLLTSRINPLWPLGAAALLGVAGLL